MKSNKHIERDGRETSKIFNNRTLNTDYRHLRSILEPGMKILDVGCGTGALSSDMATAVGPAGHVLGIDNTEKFIASGRETYSEINNLQLEHVDLFKFNTDQKFDLITSARTLQWLSDPVRALLKMKYLLKENGRISILDYNHEAIEWVPDPPVSMRKFYNGFLKWRADAGMHNRMADELPQMLKEAGFTAIEVINSDEHYHRGRPDFVSKVSIWSKVAGSTQMVEEGYIDDAVRRQAIDEYDKWVAEEAISMTMKLNEVRGFNPVASTAITSGEALSQAVIDQGIFSWEELAHCVRVLPYGRNSSRDDFSLVLKEGKGTCSSKHAFLKKIADQNQVPGVQLMLGLYRMNRENTPGIGNALSDHGLEYLPEAHCYLVVHGERLDMTSPSASFERIRDDLILEKEIEAEQVVHYKVGFHRGFLEKWMERENLDFTFDEMWAIRENCIQNISVS